MYHVNCGGDCQVGMIFHEPVDVRCLTLNQGSSQGYATKDLALQKWTGYGTAGGSGWTTIKQFTDLKIGDGPVTLKRGRDCQAFVPEHTWYTVTSQQGGEGDGAVVTVRCNGEGPSSNATCTDGYWSKLDLLCRYDGASARTEIRGWRHMSQTVAAARSADWLWRLC